MRRAFVTDAEGAGPEYDGVTIFRGGVPEHCFVTPWAAQRADSPPPIPASIMCGRSGLPRYVGRGKHTPSCGFARAKFIIES